MMAADANDSAARGQRVDEVIAIYLQAVDAGEAPDPEEFIEKHREIADELSSFFANCGQLARFADENKGDKSNFPERPEGYFAQIGLIPFIFGDYELLEEIARGGMGVVYKARQISLNRIVALKMILAGHLASQEDVQRFHVEAEATANLDHPGIVPIYEVGEHDGQHYFSMGYVDGFSLADRLREGPLPSRSAATLLKLVCEAVHYAHEHDVIHRDLKPANILLERSRDSKAEGRESRDKSREPESHTEPAANPPSGPQFRDPRRSSLASRLSSLDSCLSRPRITDFGLAKRLKSDADLTRAGQVLGTPSYMSPEQAAGATHTIGPASDVYSLGAILYQLLTGRPPFQAETPLATLSQILDSDPLPPRLLNRNVPRDLEAICMKCLEKKSLHRYPSARDLGDELERYLEGETIHASGVNLLDRMTRAVRQSRHEEHFRGWGLGLMAFGLVIFLSHIAIFIADRAGLDSWALDPWTTYFLPRSVMFAALLVMLWRFRRHSVLPTKSAERLIWVVWIGYLLALGAVNVARIVFGHDHGEVYASAAVLAGFGFLIMGGHVWGGGYLVGLLFMIAAPVLAMYADVAPLGFGGLWAGALLAFGLHYWRRGRAVLAGDSTMS